MANPFSKLGRLRRYPSLSGGVILLGVFVVMSIYTIIAVPYSQAEARWNNPQAWDYYPKNAGPAWVDLFTRGKTSRTLIVYSEQQGIINTEQLDDGSKSVNIVLPFNYEYDGFPRDINLFFEGDFRAADIPVTTSWETPDGRTILLRENRLTRSIVDTYYISQDTQLQGQLEAMLGIAARMPHIGLFASPTDTQTPVKGEYRLVVVARLPADGYVKTRLVVYGQVYGLAGTDHKGRDLMIALLWGAPIGLAFGLLAAIGANLSTFVLAGVSTWLGGMTDKIFQWLTQVSVILPTLPILILVGYLYSRSIWAMLGLIIALNVFSGSMFTYRAMYLQAKEAPYIEAAQAYGAGSARIIFRYLLPRIAPTLLPHFVLVVPQFIFLEATLSVLGLGDPRVPTWGKIINDAYSAGALYTGHYYWIIEPAVLLMLMGTAFALIGYAVDRIFNPRLRTL
jgi:peptide/nickel transport system permease protein